MRKITLAVLIVFTFSMLINYKIILLVITGLTSAIVSLTVSANVQGVITSFTYPSSVAVNNPMNFSVSFKNVGNINIVEKIRIFIKSTDMQTSAILSDDTFTLGMGETRIFNTTYVPTSGGNFFAFVVVTYDSKTAEANASFTVTTPLVVLPAAPPAPFVKVPVVNLTLEYPKTITLTQGQSSLIGILVKNVGNVELNNLILTPFSNEIFVESKPFVISILSPGSSALFLLSVKAPDRIPLGTYTINFTLTSDKITKRGEIKVIIEIQKIELELELTIRNYELLISLLMQEAYKAEKEGRNVTDVFEILSEAKDELGLAKQFFEAKDYNNTRQKLLVVKEKIEQAALELAQVIRPKIIFVPVPFPRPEIAGTLAAGLGSTFVLYYRKRKEEEAYRKSIRNAIQIIKNRGKQ